MPDTPAIRIARLQSSDAADYRTLMLAAYALHPDAFTSTAQEREQQPLSWWAARIGAEDDAGEQVIGAWVDGTLAGVVGVSYERRAKTRHKSGLFGMYVAAPFRQLGLGRQLVEAALALARQRDGVRLMQLTVSEGNASALRLYQSCGFMLFGTEPYAVQHEGRFISKLHLWRDLHG
ncbi:N-acetyltransferase family protein [Chitinimonas sp.]|uniref:GNAT family N-acetyltransferase n=1 Tax=Chitinimonas sp. TaxID=1934313 RepID=UPI0035AE1C4C